MYPEYKYSQILKYIKQMNLGSSKEQAPSASALVTTVQEQLSRCFMNYAKDQLINKQFSLMMETNLLLQTLANRVTHKNNETYDKDFCNVIASRTLDTLMNDEDDLPRFKHRPFTRKTNHPPPQRLLNPDSNFTSALEQIKENCSARTFSTVSHMVSSYNKLKTNSKQIKSQLNTSGNGIIRSRPDTDRSNSDQSLILTARYLKIQKQNALLNQRIRQLEEKLAQVQVQQPKEVPDLIKDYMSSRQKQIQSHEQKIQKHHEAIITNLQAQIIEDGCNRCCVLVKKIKESLISYKMCLNEQIETYRTLWEKLHLESESTRQGTQNSVANQ